MTGRRARWIGVGFAVAIAAQTFGGIAQAASIDASPTVAARIATAPDLPGVVLAGFTSQQYPTFFKISGDGRTLTVGAIALQMTCTSGAQFVLEDAFGPVLIGPNGHLRAGISIPPTAGSGGATFSGTDSLTARLGRRRTHVSGTWHLKVNYSYANGMSDACDSGPVRFTATQ
jgi:hypothetical protein